MKKLLLSVLILSSFLSAWASAAALRFSGGMAIAGPDSAPVTIQEFADFLCPYCASGANVIKQILEAYPTQVRLVFRNSPLPSHGELAQEAARAMVAVWMQRPDLAYAFQEETFRHQPELNRDGGKYLDELAGHLGINVSQMRQDILGPQVEASLVEDHRQFEAHDFRGTPSFVIGDEEVQGTRSFEEFKKIIDRQL
jgi:protein-disulfide isomerase